MYINLTPEELEAMLDHAARHGAHKSIWSITIKLITVALLTFIAGAVWMTMNNKV